MQTRTTTSQMRFDVRDELGDTIRRFATKHEAQHFAALDPDLWVYTRPRIKEQDPCTTAYSLLGPALI